VPKKHLLFCLETTQEFVCLQEQLLVISCAVELWVTDTAMQETAVSHWIPQKCQLLTGQHNLL